MIRATLVQFRRHCGVVRRMWLLYDSHVLIWGESGLHRTIVAGRRSGAMRMWTCCPINPLRQVLVIITF